jgi:hypothetical protein
MGKRVILTEAQFRNYMRFQLNKNNKNKEKIKKGDS